MGARDGKAYIDGLRDGRQVWLEGRKVKDVTAEPLLRPVIDATARLYDMQHEPAYREALTIDSPRLGERIGRSYHAPTTLAELRARGNAISLWMQESCGFLGRSPDYLATLVTALGHKSGFFASQSKERQQAVESYYRHAATKDLFLTHALHDPQVDRSKRRSEQPDPGIALHIVEKNEKGVVVSGAKSVATAAAFADDILLWPAVPNFGPGDEPYALSCVVPLASDGIKIICRPSFTNPGRRDDFPLSSRYDEMDSVVVFERVLVPWERVFLYEDLNLITKMYSRARIRELSAHQTNIRLQVKLEFIYALLVRMAQAIGVEAVQPVAISLGEAAAYIEIVRASVSASEYGAQVDPENGVLYPDFDALMAGRLMGPRLYPEFVHKLRRLGASGLMQLPASIGDFEGELGDELTRFYRGAHISAREKVALAKCAWDICGSEFGSRHSLYELYYAGDPDNNLARMQREYGRKDALLERFDTFFKSVLDDPASKSTATGTVQSKDKTRVHEAAASGR